MKQKVLIWRKILGSRKSFPSQSKVIQVNFISYSRNSAWNQFMLYVHF